MLADVLQRFLHDTQDRGLLHWIEHVARRPEFGLDGCTGECRPALDRVHDGAVEAQLVQQRWPQLADECPDLPELAAEQLSKEAQLAAGHSDVFADYALDVFDLEDGVPQRLSPPVVHLLGEPGALDFLSLADPYL